MVVIVVAINYSDTFVVNVKAKIQWILDSWSVDEESEGDAIIT